MSFHSQLGLSLSRSPLSLHLASLAGVHLLLELRDLHRGGESEWRWLQMWSFEVRVCVLCGGCGGRSKVERTGGRR